MNLSLFMPTQVLPRYVITLTPDLANTVSLRPKFTHFTKADIKKILIELTFQIHTGMLAQVLHYRLESIKNEEKPLDQEELIELGHLMYLAKAPEKAEESARFLINKIMLEKISNQTPIFL